VDEAEKSPRERILQASLELFVEQGYFNTNIPDISKRSKCSVGSIYHHFLNKEEIARDIYRDGIKQFRKALTDSLVLENNPNLKEIVQNIVIAFLRFAEEHRLLSRYLWLSRHNEFLSNKLSQPTVVGFDKLGRILTKGIRSAIKSGKIPNLDASVIWTILFGIPISYIRDWLDGHTSRPPSEVSTVIAQACWAALNGCHT
jgi:AcrR family transcriptional regulator